jgi:hypothetical protein
MIAEAISKNPPIMAIPTEQVSKQQKRNQKIKNQSRI